MKNHKNIYIFLLLFGLFLNIHSIHSQNINDISTYNWFDKTVNKENLDINNGTLHTNPYRTVGDDNMYYPKDKYEVGNLIYENQIYYNVSLKYDIYRDILVLQPSEKEENRGINLIPEKVQSFSIKDKNFLKIENTNTAQPEFVSGYYEETKVASNFKFYIKHHKDIQKKLNDNGITYNFSENNLFFINLDDKTYSVKSKSDITKIFPKQKKEINEFYLMNRELKQSDLNQFMKNLMKYINKSLSIQNK